MNDTEEKPWRDFTKVSIREYVEGCQNSWSEGFRWGVAAGILFTSVVAALLAWL